MKLKKCLSAALAMIVAISAASVPSLAVASLTVDGTDAGGEVSAAESRRGVLVNGLEYEIIQMTESWREEIHGGFDADTFTLQWSGKKRAPFRNGDGVNGEPLGGQHEPSVFSPEDTAVIMVGGLPRTTMSTVDLCVYATDGSWCEWIGGIGRYSKIILRPTASLTSSYSTAIATSEAYSYTTDLATGVLADQTYPPKAEYPVQIHVMTPQERDAFSKQTAHIPTEGHAFLTQNNAAGTNGTICAPFQADKANMSFVLTSAPGAADYNIQLYAGTPGQGVPASSYAAVCVNNGVYFSGLTEGQNYYFKISSNTVPSGGCTAVYAMLGTDKTALEQGAALRATAEMFSLEGPEAAIYNAVSQYYSDKLTAADFGLPALGVAGTYQNEAGNTCYVLECHAYLCFFAVKPPEGDSPAPWAGHEHTWICVELSEDNTVVSFTPAGNGEGSDKDIRELCGPLTSLAEQILTGAAPESERVFPASSPVEMFEVFINASGLSLNQEELEPILRELSKP